MFTWRDTRLAVRSLLNAPSFTALVLVTLALGIGANTAVFTLVDAVLFKSLPVRRPAELYRLGERNTCCVIGGLQNSYSIFSYPLYKYIQQQTSEFSELAGFQAGTTSITARLAGGSDVALPFSGKFVSENYFTMFGVRAFAGRVLETADDRPGAPPIAVMSYRTWRDRFGANPAVVGGAMIFNGFSVMIAGIADPGFFGDTLRPDPADFWIPLGAEPVLRGKASLLSDPSQSWLDVIGRLQPSAKPAQIQVRLTSLLQQWLSDRQDLGLQETSEKERIPQQHIVLSPGGSGISALSAVYGDGLRMLSAISALVLIIACANVANLLLARVNQFQISIRAALGATRVRLIGQTLSEGIVLALAGGALGIVVAYGGARAILLLAFRGAKFIPIEASPSPVVLGFALVLSLLTGIVFSAAPALILSKTNPIDSLRGGSRFTADRAAMPRNAMVVTQAALAFVMLVAAGLLTVSLWRLEHQSFGFQTDGRVVVKINPSLTDYTDERLAGLYRQLHERLNNLPGVRSASFSLYSPMEGDNWQSGVSVEGRPIDLRNDSASWDRVGPRYFETIGTQLIAGRTIDDRDTPVSTHAAVVNEAFVQKYLSSSDPIGKHFGLGDRNHTGDFEVVGVVSNAKYSQPDRDVWPFFFIPYFQSGHYDQEQDLRVMRRSNYVQSLELRLASRLENLEQTVREVLSQIDPNLTVMSVVSLDEQLSGNFNQQRLIARLTSLYGVIALLLAGIGLYGVAAYGVKRRTAEIGVRMALGADRGRVVGMVLRGALLQVTAGLGIGIPAALAAGRLLSAKLFGVTGHDVIVLGSSALVIIIAAVLAAIVPAARAASIDPMKALRIE